MQPLDPRVIENIIQFLRRVDLKGDEAFAYCEAVEELKKLKSDPAEGEHNEQI